MDALIAASRRSDSINRLGALIGGCCLLWIGLSTAHAQNSTKTRRVQPNEISRKAGTGVAWVRSLKAAQEIADKTGKPIFWYVSTVPGTFMDRKPVINRYMLGGPFSWPPIISLLNNYFVPIRQLPKKSEQDLGVKPYDFVEPGFLILGAKGKPLFKLDQVTTFHYEWLEQILIQQVKKTQQEVKPLKWPAYYREFSGAPENWIDPVGPTFERNAANLLLSGMIAFRKGDQQLAKQRWQEAVELDPAHPLAWKASLEAQGIGPFVRGFESFRTIPPRAKLAGIQSRGSTSPSGTYSRQEVIRRSIDFLLGMQRHDGAFVDSDYDFGGFDSLPNVHVAVTALAGMALLKFARSQPENLKQVELAIVKAARFVADDHHLNLVDRDEILWAQAYRLRFLARLSHQKILSSQVPGFEQRLKSAIQGLERIQLKTGNWYHEYNNPFVTATALCALHEAQASGAETDSEKIKRGVKSLLQDRIENGAYPYYSARRPVSRTEKDLARMLSASAGRMPLCELALVKWGEKKQKELMIAVENSLANHRYLASAYKYDNHTSTMAYGGFFFWYDMRSRSEAIRAVEDEKKRQLYQRQHQQLIDQLPEVDGCFVDSHELGRCYGTAMALLSMD